MSGTKTLKVHRILKLIYNLMKFNGKMFVNSSQLTFSALEKRIEVDI